MKKDVNDVNDWPAEKKMAHELQKLTDQVRRLREEIRGGAIPAATSHHGPVFPTEPERRLRPITKDPKKGPQDG